MANSRKSKSSELQDAVAAVLARHVPPHAHLKLGFSGGIDSRVLLDVLAHLAPELPFKLSCVHVNHGISPHAAEWARFARRTVQAYGLSCTVKQVDIQAHRHLGLEGAARAARYEVFARVKADFVLSAQHLDDQAETLLSQLVRGAGVAGLAAMPEMREFAPGKKLLRPLLNISRAQIEAYAKARGLGWVEDESNADTALGRNFLRHEVLPRLAQLNPAATLNLARSAAHLGDAAQLLEDLAAMDAQHCVRANVLALDELKKLGAPRARNLMRAWLSANGAGTPGAAELEEMLQQLFAAKVDAQVRLHLNGFVLRRFKQTVRLESAQDAPPRNFSATWNGAKDWPLAELGGLLRFEERKGAGIALHLLQEPAKVLVRLRQGGEHFRPDARRPRRSLKKLFQEQGIAPWQRDRLPLLYSANDLIFVPGLGVSAAAQAGPGEPGLEAHWLSA